MAGAAIMWPIQYPMMSAVTPATYSNSLTYQEILYLIKEKLDEVVEFTDTISGRVNELTMELARNRAETLEAVEKELNILREENRQMKQELLALIADVSVGGSSFDPTDGSTHKPVSEVMENMWDYLRTSARFVGQVDALGLTAAQWDAQGLTARQFDLDPENVLNHSTEN